MDAKVGIAFPLFQWGGAEAVLVWMVEALKRQHKVSVITLDPPDLVHVNQFYGTAIHDTDVEWRCFGKSRLLGPYLPLTRRSFSFRQDLIARYVRTMASDFHILVSAFNEMDMGRPGVQYVHFPLFASDGARLRRELGYPHSRAHSLARRFLQLSMGWSVARVRANRTLANSRWTADAVRAVYNANCEVVYPPVWTTYPNVPWEEREEGFVLVARGVPEKQILRAVRILHSVRNAGLDVHLHVVGEPVDSRVAALLSQAHSEYGDWIHLEGRTQRERLSSLLSSHKYGLHVREFEQFGIAVAEMVRAGCIPFVPRSGGQVEIVNSNPAVTFRSNAEAASNMVQVARDARLQAAVRVELARCAENFSVSQFCKVMRTIVDEELARR